MHSNLNERIEIFSHILFTASGKDVKLARNQNPLIQFSDKATIKLYTFSLHRK